MALTELVVRKAKAQDKPYRLGDGKGLWLYDKTALSFLSFLNLAAIYLWLK